MHLRPFLHNHVELKAQLHRNDFGAKVFEKCLQISILKSDWLIIGTHVIEVCVICKCDGRLEPVQKGCA